MTRQKSRNTRSAVSGLINLNFGNKITNRSYMYPCPHEVTKGSEAKLQVPIEGGDYEVITRSDAVAVVDLVIPLVNGNDSVFEQMTAVMMAKLRAVNTSVVTYTAKDLKAYLLNVRSIIAEITFIQRYLASLRSFVPYDGNSPESIQQVCFPGQTFPDGSNVGDTLNRLKVMLARVQTLLPTATPFTHQAATSFSYVLRDSPLAKFAMKAFVLGRANAFKVSVHENGVQGGLIADLEHTIDNYDENGAPINITTLISKVEKWINSISSDPTIIMMAADIFKAFGSSAVTPFMTVDPNTMVVPIYDEDLLTQWENMTILPNAHLDVNVTPFSKNHLPVVSEEEVVLDEYVYESGNATPPTSVNIRGTEGYKYKRINVNSDRPTSTDTLRVIRYTTTYTSEVRLVSNTSGVDAAITTKVLTTPGELIVGYYYNYKGDWMCVNPQVDAETVTSGAQRVYIVSYAMPDGTYDPNVTYASVAWSMNDWEPALTEKFTKTMYDLKNWAVVDSNNLGTFIEWIITGSVASPSEIVKQERFNL